MLIFFIVVAYAIVFQLIKDRLYGKSAVVLGMIGIVLILGCFIGSVYFMGAYNGLSDQKLWVENRYSVADEDSDSYDAVIADVKYHNNAVEDYKKNLEPAEWIFNVFFFMTDSDKLYIEYK